MGKIVAFKCEYCGTIFDDEKKYTSHVKKEEDINRSVGLGIGTCHAMHSGYQLHQGIRTRAGSRSRRQSV